MAKRITITLTDEEYNIIKEKAERDYRTFNAELKYLLRFSNVFDYATVPTATAGLSYPPGVRSAENPTGEHIVTTEYSKHKKSVIG